MSVPGPTQTRHRVRHEPSRAIPGETFQSGHHRVEASSEIPAWHTESWTETASGQQDLRSGWRSSHAQVRVFMGDHAGCEAKYIQALFSACGQHVSIDLRSDSSGAIGVASRRGWQRLRHLDGRFLWLQQETAQKKVRISNVPGPENVADTNTKPAAARVLSHEHGHHRDSATAARLYLLIHTQSRSLCSWLHSGNCKTALATHFPPSLLQNQHERYPDRHGA